MLIDINHKTNAEIKKEKNISYKYDNYFPEHVTFLGEPWEILSKHIGKIEMGGVYNFWTFGRYAMVEVLNHILRQVGTAEVSACTWAITKDSVIELLNRRKDGLLKEFKMWIDPRVRVRNPEPLQMLQANFDVVIAPVHAKVTIVKAENFCCSISGSLNFTSNPQPERGIIQCIQSIYETDKKIIDDEFSKGNRFRLSEC